MEWYFTVKVIFGAAMQITLASPADFPTRAECLAYGLDTAIERAAWRQPESIEVTCNPAGLAMVRDSIEDRYAPPPTAAVGD
ncbi:MAG: hypothetical protein NXI16_08165 [Alphaproteobacteria bacterium]|nr:hypothetical protein [Alphaproteobacteria bacterium]